MNVVIDINEDLYTRLFDNGVDNYDDAVDMAKAIRKGTPLPKGHGRLIDEKEVYKKFYDRCLAEVAKEVLDKTSTIIEADNKYEAKVITRGNCMMCGKELTEGLFFCKECKDKGK